MKTDIEQFDIYSSKLQSLSQVVLQEAARCGADQAAVAIVANKGFSVSARQGEVETVEYNQDKSIEIDVYFGKRCGSASISDIRPEAIRSAVEAACHIAKFTHEDHAAGLAEVEELAFGYPQLPLNFPWPLSVEEAIQMACECEQEALKCDRRIINAEDVSVATHEACNIYANSKGFTGSFIHSRHEMSCVLVAKEHGDMQRDYSYTVSPDPACLRSVSDLAKEAAGRVVRRLGGKSMATKRSPVIFVAEEARSLIGLFAAAIQGGNVYRKSSFLVGKLGKQLFPTFIEIKERPHLEKALGSAPFDDDGVATRDNLFVQGGILQHYALGTYSARKLNMKSTGNAGGVHNLTIAPGNQGLDELLKTMGEGLLITELMGQGANLTTGDYSRGAGGFWVKNGEVQFPVHEVTIASTLPDMFAQIVAVGNDIDVRGNIRTGSILLEQMMVAGA